MSSRAPLLVLSILTPLAACTGKDDAADSDSAPVEIEEECPQGDPLLTETTAGDLTLTVACQGTGPDVILLHGFPEHWYAWNSVMDELDGEFQLFAPNLNGHESNGVSADVTEYSFDVLVEDLDALIDAIGAEDPILVGHDFGGTLAWLYASQHPEKVDRLMIVNGPHPDVLADSLVNDNDQQAASAYIDFLNTADAEPYLKKDDFKELGVFFFPSSFTEEDEQVYRDEWARDENIVTGMLNWFRANLPNPYVPSELPDGVFVSMPTTVVWSESDDFFLFDAQTSKLSSYGDVTLIEADDGEHWLQHDDPVLIADTIRAIEEERTTVPDFTFDTGPEDSGR